MDGPYRFSIDDINSIFGDRFVMEGNDDNDFLYGFDGLPNNDNLDGGEDPDIFQSEPDPEVNCERS
jgi:hypothetical protein